MCTQVAMFAGGFLFRVGRTLQGRNVFFSFLKGCFQKRERAADVSDAKRRVFGVGMFSALRYRL